MKPSAINNLFAIAVVCLAIGLLLSRAAFAAEEIPDPSKCDLKGGETCKKECDPETETLVSFCSPDMFTYKCCRLTEKLGAGQGGCAKEGALCQAKCKPPLIDSGEKCLQGTRLCCVPPEAVVGAGSPTTLVNPLGAGATFYTVIQRVISAFLGMVGALALAVFVYAGVMWMTAGSSDRIQQAKDAMKYAIIGLAMIAFSYAITTFFINTLTGRLTGQSGAAPVQYAPPPEPSQ